MPTEKEKQDIIIDKISNLEKLYAKDMLDAKIKEHKHTGISFIGISIAYLAIGISFLLDVYNLAEKKIIGIATLIIFGLMIIFAFDEIKKGRKIKKGINKIGGKIETH